MGTVPSVCVVVSEISAPANAQLGTFVLETEWEVAAAGSVGNVHAGTSSETVTVAEGASANMATSAVSEVGWTEGKTGPCAAFNVHVVGQDMNTTRDVLSKLGGGSGAHLTFGAGVGTGTELVGSAGVVTGMNDLLVTEGLRVA